MHPFLKNLTFGSPDLSRIEPLWAIVKSKLRQHEYSSIDEMKKKLIRIWESIPNSLRKKLCGSFNKRLQLCKQYNGRRLDRELLKKLKKTEKVEHKWFPHFYDEEFEPERIIYNDVIIEKLKKKHIAKTRKEITAIKSEYREIIRNAKWYPPLAFFHHLPSRAICCKHATCVQQGCVRTIRYVRSHVRSHVPSAIH
jgi:hypothetical protein